MVTLTGSHTFSDDYPWLRSPSPFGETIDIDVSPLLPGDPEPVPAATEARVLDNYGVAWAVRVLDDSIEPPKLALFAPSSPAHTSLPCTAAQTGVRYLVGNVGGVLVADPQRWTSDALAKGLVGWLLFSETTVDALSVRDTVATDYTNQQVSAAESDRQWDAERGWSLAVAAGNDPTLMWAVERGLGASTTTSFWIKAENADNAAFLTHGPLRCSLVQSGLSLYVQAAVEKTDLSTASTTLQLEIGAWNYVSVTVTPALVTLRVGSDATATTSATVAGSFRAFSTAPVPRSTSTAATGSANFAVQLTSPGTDPASVRISVNSEAWLLQDALQGQGASAKVAQLRYADGLPVVQFGNGFDGKIPATGATVTVAYATQDSRLVLRATGTRFQIADFRTYRLEKTAAEIEEIRKPSLVPAPLEWSTRFIEASNKKNRYALQVLPCGIVYAVETAGYTNHDRDQSFVTVSRYDGQGAYIGDDAREATGIGGGAEPPALITLGSRVLGYDAASVLVYSGSFAAPQGVTTVSKLTNPVAHRIYVHDGSLTYAAKIVADADGVRLRATPVTQDSGSDAPDLPNIPTDGQTYTYQGSWAPQSYASLSVVLRGSTYWYATGAALAANIPPSAPWIPAHSLYFTRFNEVLTDAVTVYGSHSRSLGIMFGSQVWATGANTGTQAPVYLYANTSVALAVSDATSTWVGGGLLGSGYVETAVPEDLEFSHATTLPAGRYRLYLDIANHGLLDRGFTGFDFEISVGNTATPSFAEGTVFADRAGEQDPRSDGTDYVEITIPSDLTDAWTLTLRWTNLIANNDNWQRVLQVYGYTFELQQAEVYRVDIPTSASAVTLTHVDVETTGSQGPGGWIGYVNSYGTVSAGSWVHESRAYSGDSVLPYSSVLHSTTPNKQEDLYADSWYAASTPSGPVAAPTVVTVGSRERALITASIAQPVGTLRYAWDFGAWGGGWTDGQTVTTVPEGYGSLPYTAYAIDPNGYYASTTGTIFVREAPDLKYVRTLEDDAIVPYVTYGTAYGTCRSPDATLSYEYYLNDVQVGAAVQSAPFGAIGLPITCTNAGPSVLRVVCKQHPVEDFDTFDEIYLNIHGKQSLAPSVSPIQPDPAVLYAEATGSYTFTAVAYDEDGAEEDLTFAWGVEGKQWNADKSGYLSSVVLPFYQTDSAWGNERMQSSIKVPTALVAAGEDYVISVEVTDAHERSTAKHLTMIAVENTPPELVKNADGSVVTVTPGVEAPTNTTIIFDAARAVDAEQQFPLDYEWSLWLHAQPILPLAHTVEGVTSSKFWVSTDEAKRKNEKNNEFDGTGIFEFFSKANPTATMDLYCYIEGTGTGDVVDSNGKQTRGIYIWIQITDNGLPSWQISGSMLNPVTGERTVWYATRPANFFSAHLTEEQLALVDYRPVTTADPEANPRIFPRMRLVSTTRLTTNQGVSFDVGDTDAHEFVTTYGRGNTNTVTWNDLFPARFRIADDSGTDVFGDLHLKSYPEELAIAGTSVVVKFNVARQATPETETTVYTKTAALYAAADAGQSATITGSLTLTDDRGGQATYPVPEVTLRERCLPPAIIPASGPVDAAGPVIATIIPRDPVASVRYTQGRNPDAPTDKSGLIYAHAPAVPQIFKITVLKDYVEGKIEWYYNSFILRSGAKIFYFWFANQSGRGEETPEPELAPEGAILVDIPFNRSDMSTREATMTATFVKDSVNVTVTTVGIDLIAGKKPIYENWEIVDDTLTTGGTYVIRLAEDITPDNNPDDDFISDTSLISHGATAATLQAAIRALDYMHMAIVTGNDGGPYLIDVVTQGVATAFTLSSVSSDLDVSVDVERTGTSSRSKRWTVNIASKYIPLAGGEYVDSVTSANTFTMSSPAIDNATSIPVTLTGGHMNKTDIARLVANAINSQPEFTATVLGKDTVSVVNAGTGEHDFGRSESLVLNAQLSRASGVVTVASTGHGLATGNLVAVVGASPDTFNIGRALVTVTSADTFTYPRAGSNGSTSNSVLAEISITNPTIGYLAHDTIAAGSDAVSTEITVAVGDTVKAVAYREGYYPSYVTTAKYVAE